MNISQAKQIKLLAVVEHFGGRISHQKVGETWLYSPFRPDERTGSFKINEKLNTWYDFAEGKGGSVIDFWLDFHNQDRKNGEAIKAALKGLEVFSGGIVAAVSKQRPAASKSGQQEAFKTPPIPPRFKLVKQPGKIYLDSLKTEIGRRGLTLAVALPYLKQGNILDTETGKSYKGFCFENDQQGHEISIPNPSQGKSFKTSIGPKAPTSFTTGAHTSALIFEGFWDFLTWLQMTKNKPNTEDLYILNSVSFANQVAEKLISRKHTVKSVFLFLDNDVAGEKATNQMALALEPHGFTIGTKNHVYEGYKDLNDFWINHSKIKDTPTRQNDVRMSLDTAWNHIKPGQKPTS